MSLRDLQQQRLRPDPSTGSGSSRAESRGERGAEFRLRQGYGETSPKLKERRRAPRESERGWGPASIEKRRQSADDNAPATVVIGEVVRLGALLGAQAEADEAAAGGQ
jgi:hypothetical protein